MCRRSLFVLCPVLASVHSSRAVRTRAASHTVTCLTRPHVPCVAQLRVYEEGLELLPESEQLRESIRGVKLRKAEHDELQRKQTDPAAPPPSSSSSSSSHTAPARPDQAAAKVPVHRQVRTADSVVVVRPSTRVVFSRAGDVCCLQLCCVCLPCLAGSWCVSSTNVVCVFCATVLYNCSACVLGLSGRVARSCCRAGWCGRLTQWKAVCGDAGEREFGGRRPGSERDQPTALGASPLLVIPRSLVHGTCPHAALHRTWRVGTIARFEIL